MPVISKIELMEDEDDVEREEGAEIMGEDALRKEDLEGEQAEDGEDGEDEGNLSKQHEELVSTIFSEQEALVACHREQIHAMMNLVKDEMAALDDIETPGGNIDAYVKRLETIIEDKRAVLATLSERVGRV